ncbi:hypothetical protein VNO77_05242 [Canavalia gladiata]|uniref:Uncharacterized protein n=1 Tax=Canavalia gladiata TaxID=3824 RepID=A0AAN9N367_CANGL
MSSFCHPLRTEARTSDDEAYDESRKGESSAVWEEEAKCSEERSRGEAVQILVAEEGIFLSHATIFCGNNATPPTQSSFLFSFIHFYEELRYPSPVLCPLCRIWSLIVDVTCIDSFAITKYLYLHVLY